MLRVAALCAYSAIASAHASFGRVATLELCRSFASRRTDVIDFESLVRGRLALEDKTSFGVLGGESENLILFVCSAVGQDVHRLNACVWPLVCDKRSAIRELRRYHSETFGESCVLTAGALDTVDADVWNGGDV